jgi:putative aldouronate transport system substrate-binding protein
MKRNLVTIPLSVLLVSSFALAACGDKETPASSSVAASTTAATTTTAPKPTDNTPTAITIMAPLNTAQTPSGR